MKTPRLKIALYPVWFGFCFSACCEVVNSQSHFLLTRFCQLSSLAFPRTPIPFQLKFSESQALSHSGVRVRTNLKAYFLGKIPDMGPGRPATRGFWFRGLVFFFFFFPFL